MDRKVEKCNREIQGKDFRILIHLLRSWSKLCIAEGPNSLINFFEWLGYRWGQVCFFVSLFHLFSPIGACCILFVCLGLIVWRPFFINILFLCLCLSKNSSPYVILLYFPNSLFLVKVNTKFTWVFKSASNSISNSLAILDCQNGQNSYGRIQTFPYFAPNASELTTPDYTNSIAHTILASRNTCNQVPRIEIHSSLQCKYGQSSIPLPTPRFKLQGNNDKFDPSQLQPKEKMGYLQDKKCNNIIFPFTATFLVSNLK